VTTPSAKEALEVLLIYAHDGAKTRYAGDEVDRMASTLRAFIESAGRDAERLDWTLANRNFCVQGSGANGWVVMDCRNGLTFFTDRCATARGAIDAGMLKTTNPHGKETGS